MFSFRGKSVSDISVTNYCQIPSLRTVGLILVTGKIYVTNLSGKKIPFRNTSPCYPSLRNLRGLNALTMVRRVFDIIPFCLTFFKIRFILIQLNIISVRRMIVPNWNNPKRCFSERFYLLFLFRKRPTFCGPQMFFLLIITCIKPLKFR